MSNIPNPAEDPKRTPPPLQPDVDTFATMAPGSNPPPLQSSQQPPSYQMPYPTMPPGGMMPPPQRPPNPNPQARAALSILLGTVAVLMLITFFAVNWYNNDPDKAQDAWDAAVDDANDLVEESADDSGASESTIRGNLRDFGEQLIDDDSFDTDCLTLTAWEMSLGTKCYEGEDSDEDDYAILTNSDDEDNLEGFGDVGTPERVLLLYLFAAFGLLIATGLYSRRVMDDRVLGMAMLGLAAVAFLAPLIWSTWRSSAWNGELADLLEDSIEDSSDDAGDDFIALFKAVRAAGLAATGPAALGFIALVAAGAVFIEQRNGAVTQGIGRAEPIIQLLRARAAGRMAQQRQGQPPMYAGYPYGGPPAAPYNTQPTAGPVPPPVMVEEPPAPSAPMADAGDPPATTPTDTATEAPPAQDD